MTGTRPPSVDAVAVLYRLFLRGQLTRLRAIALALLGLISVFLTVLARGDVDRVRIATGVIAQYGIGVVAPISTLWIATALIGELAEDRLLAYLWLKPVPRWAIPTAAVAATLTVTVPLVIAPLTLAAVVSGVSGLTMATIAASALAVFAYSGLFVALGTRFTRALWWGLLYVLVWENSIARISDGTARLSVRTYPMSILADATDVHLARADRSPVASVVVPLLLGLVGIALATRTLSRRDVD